MLPGARGPACILPMNELVRTRGVTVGDGGQVP